MAVFFGNVINFLSTLINLNSNIGKFFSFTQNDGFFPTVFRLIFIVGSVHLLFKSIKNFFIKKEVIKDIKSQLESKNMIDAGKIAPKYSLTQKQFDKILGFAKSKNIFSDIINDTTKVLSIGDVKSDFVKNKYILLIIENSLFNIRNTVILGITVVIYAYLKKFGLENYMLIAGILSIISSTIYYILFEKDNPKEQHKLPTNNLSRKEINKVLAERVDKLNPTVSKIDELLDTLKKLDDSKYSIISERMCDIIEFERIVPLLVRNYRNAVDFIDSREKLTGVEMSHLKTRLSNTVNESAKSNIRVAIRQKEEILNEIKAMHKNIEECESTLEFILSALQKIETIIHSSQINNNLSPGQTENIREQFDGFSEVLRNVASNIKL